MAWFLKVNIEAGFWYSLCLWQTETEQSGWTSKPYNPHYTRVFTIIWIWHNGNVLHWRIIGPYIMSRNDFGEVRGQIWGRKLNGIRRWIMSWLLWSAALGNDNVELILVGWKGNDYRENEAIYWALLLLCVITLKLSGSIT